MSKYSFLLQSEEPEFFELSPKLRLRKEGGWLAAESIEQEELGKLQSQSSIRAVQLAKRIAVAKNVSVDEAFALLQGGSSTSEMELLNDFTEETLSLINSGGNVELGNARMMTVFMRCRGEGLVKGGEWSALDDWSIEDTKSMGRRLIAKGIEFMASEQESEAKEVGQENEAGQEKKAPRRTKEALPSD